MKEGLPFFRTPGRTTLPRCPQNTDIAALRSNTPVTRIFSPRSFRVLRQAGACTKGSGIYTVHRQHKRLPVSFFHNAGDVPSNACRVHAVLLVVLHLTDAPGDTSAVFIIAENAFLTCLCKSGADVTQLYDGNMDAVGLDFVCKRVRIKRNGGFACGVEGLERNVRTAATELMFTICPFP